MGKTYVCNRYPFLSIGDSVHFKDCMFTADNAEQERLVESNDWFNVYIWPRDTPEEVEALRLAREAEKAPRVRQGMRGSRG